MTKKIGYWLLINMKTGLMDGIYLSEDMALSSLEYFLIDRQEPDWVLTRIVDPKGPFNLPDHLFHATANQKVYRA